MSRANKICELRELIGRHLSSPAAQERAYLETGIGPLDAMLEGGLWKGAILELTGEAKTSGSSLLMRAILRHAAATGHWFALIDGLLLTNFQLLLLDLFRY